jgi:hypothetical protein
VATLSSRPARNCYVWPDIFLQSAVSSDLIGHTSQDQVSAWSAGSLSDWQRTSSVSRTGQTRPFTQPRRTTASPSLAFDEKVESVMGDSHEGANQIQDPHWKKRGQS